MSFKKKIKFLVLVLIFIFTSAAAAAAINWKTPAEEAYYKRYTQYEDIVRFLSLLEAKRGIL
jgi:hypothetical protein